MYFWRIDKLKKQLAIQKPNQKDLFLYLIGISFVSVVIGGLPSTEEVFQDYNYYWLDWALLSLATLVGIVGSYYANGGNKGKDFLERYIAIYFVMIIRYIVFIILGYIFLLLLGVDMNSDINNISLFASLYSLITFKSITNIKEITNIKDQNNIDL